MANHAIAASLLHSLHTCDHADGLCHLLVAIQLILLNHVTCLDVLVLVVDVLGSCRVAE
jgi:hypothetical protein